MIFFNKYIIITLCTIFSTNVYAQGFNSKEVPSTLHHYNANKAKSYKSVELDFIIKKSNSTQELTKLIQKYIDAHNEIILPDRTITICEKGLDIGSNKTLIFQKNSVLEITPNKLSNYGIINVIKAKNVTILNANLVGDRYKHKSKNGEWGHGIRILGGDNIKIDNFKVQDCWGDGIYIGRVDNNYSKNINISNGIVNNNRRNGISITSVSGLKLDKVTAANTNGTNPQFGIDIEPNSNLDVIDLIDFGTIYSFNNRGGMLITLDKLKGKFKKKVLITIDSFFDNGSEHALFLGRLSSASNNVSGSLKIREVEVVNNQRPIIIKTFSPNTFFVEINQFNIKNPKNINFHNREVMRVNQGKENVKIRSKN